MVAGWGEEKPANTTFKGAEVGPGAAARAAASPFGLVLADPTVCASRGAVIAGFKSGMSFQSSHSGLPRCISLFVLGL
jgi:hypothetical protein